MLTLASQFDSRHAPLLPLDRWLRRMVVCGLLIVLLFPLGRGQIPWLGWAPLWLVGMPLAAWWALHRFRLPWPRRGAWTGRRRRRLGGQARRRAPMPAHWASHGARAT
ncbi:hypothetical protein [Pseudoxanthomonas indica]|uniref:Uncharacterized protein n=1 Tax=Pseudoxanthomonas indica TaxID=428993 RepID=A0A1T5LA12_9GAMM|nr:hypothetical protein [Pseudoxanthomonas indica]GGD32542.1 hypothetical protein GCM10007235_00510 [Pseudoxanthomonas indica]SKC72780.1 hypothetical protein SAMN06296058_2180 [Pseudoxanthomonas indica]